MYVFPEKHVLTPKLIDFGAVRTKTLQHQGLVQITPGYTPPDAAFLQKHVHVFRQYNCLLNCFVFSDLCKNVFGALLSDCWIRML